MLALDADTLRLRLFSKTAELPEGVARLPVKTIHINKSPVVIANLKTLPPATAERWGLHLAQGQRHAAQALALADPLAALPGRPVCPTPLTHAHSDVH